MARKAKAKCYRCSRSEPDQDIEVIAIDPQGFDEPMAHLRCRRCGHTWHAASGFDKYPGYKEAKKKFDQSGTNHRDSWLWKSRD